VTVPERIALAVVGISIAVLGVDSAVEARNGLGLVWWAVGTVGLTSVLVAVRGTLRPFGRVSRLFRLPPMA